MIRVDAAEWYTQRGASKTQHDGLRCELAPEGRVGMSEVKTTRAVERAVDILYCLADGEKQLVEISRKVGLGKSTVHRLLASLVTKGLVAQNPATSGYSLGPGFFRLLHSSLSSYTYLTAVASEPMRRLNELSGETVVLHVLKGKERLCVAEVESPQELKYTAGVGATAPVYTGAAGKLFLGCMDRKERERFVNSLEITPLTPNTITDKEQLLREAEEAAKRGYAISFGERIVGSSCISVPVRGTDGRAIAVLSILGPSVRLSKEKLLELLPALQAEANRIAHELGLGQETGLSS